MDVIILIRIHIILVLTTLVLSGCHENKQMTPHPESFDNVYGWGVCSRINCNNHILIIDENQNIVLAMCYQGHFVS